MTLKEAAVKYLAKNWPVIPINPSSKKPCVESWKDYQGRLPTIEEVENWWTLWPWANIGVVTGKLAGITVVDIDPRHGGSTEGLTDTVKAQTGGGGWHYLYEYNGNCHSQNGIEPGIDLKAEGGYIIIAPSVHASGNKYKWLTTPFLNNFAKLPERFLNNSRASKFNPEVLKGVPEGKRNESAASIIGKLLSKFPESDWLTSCWDLVRGWNLKNQPPLAETELWATFQSIASKEKGSRESRENNIENLEIEWPSPLDPAAYHGLAGDFVKLVEPHTESDPVALLINFLTVFGSIIGNGPFFQIEATKHKLKLFSVYVGDTSKARKGTALNRVRRFFGEVDEEWENNNIVSGSSSGEGLINAVRDATAKIKDGEEIVVEEGIKDKRLLLVEEEFASTLKVMSREGNTLSPIIRSAWDRGDLRTLTRNAPLKATNTHIAIIGHITRDELLRYLTGTEMANGFCNRFLWFCQRRSKELPHGGNLIDEDVAPVREQLKKAVLFAQGQNRDGWTADEIDKTNQWGDMWKNDEIRWSKEANPLWTKIYHDLTTDIPGLVGAMSARIEPYTIRLACLYCLLDLSKEIRVEHLKAAVAIIDYAVESLEYIFQNSVGDLLGNEILTALKKNPQGLTKTALNDYFGGHKSSEQISSSIASLLKINRIKVTKEITSGRPKELFQLNPLNQHPHSRIKYLDKLNQYIEQSNTLSTNDSNEDGGKSGNSGISSNDKTGETGEGVPPIT
ncbi:bifunctional DNA primase/polymerase [Candidatus Daviesbacteria bacterium]|nr:bifunctional DNA primase/polymerase [Candidatus Daviesbacteria bacterium]